MNQYFNTAICYDYFFRRRKLQKSVPLRSSCQKQLELAGVLCLCIPDITQFSAGLDSDPVQFSWIPFLLLVCDITCELLSQVTDFRNQKAGINMLFFFFFNQKSNHVFIFLSSQKLLAAFLQLLCYLFPYLQACMVCWTRECAVNTSFSQSWLRHFSCWHNFFCLSLLSSSFFM